jgi:GMP synthase (glutamine-hydrolysing)
MSRLLVCQHVAAEPLGTLDPLIRRRGHRMRFVNFSRDPDARPSLERYRGLIVLGGPMNVDEQARHPHLKTELALIEQALTEGKPVLGICLGAQLLAHVLGAPVRRHRCPEIGWYRLETTEHGRRDPVLEPLGDALPVFQWHGRTFDLPSEAVHLAQTQTCANQAFRWGEDAYGFQFHLEMDEALIERWLATPLYREELRDSGLGHDEQAIRRHTREHIGAMRSAADAVFNRFLDRVGRPARRVVLPSR